MLLTRRQKERKKIDPAEVSRPRDIPRYYTEYYVTNWRRMSALIWPTIIATIYVRIERITFYYVYFVYVSMENT